MNNDLTNTFKSMAIALFIGYKALLNNETPVACIFISKLNNEILSIGYNDTNNSLNGTKHAEFIAINQILDSYIPKDQMSNLSYIKDFFSNVSVYVTVEPCIMCASALRQIGINEVVFGCGNDRFGGNGTVLSINRDPSIDEPYNGYGGILRTEAIQLLRNFYIQENSSAPQPKIKKNKDIDNKEYPLNLQFDKYLRRDAFISFYGQERMDFFNNEVDKEITPILHEGYKMNELIHFNDLKSMSILKSFYGSDTDIDFEESLSNDLDDFFKLFYNISDNGQVDFTKKITKITQICDHKEEDSIDSKKRRLN